MKDAFPKKTFTSLNEIMNEKNVMEKIWTHNRINWLLADDNPNCRSGKDTIDPECEEEALKLAFKYNFVTDLTSMIVEEDDEYEISGILGKADPSISISTRTSLISLIASSIEPYEASIASKIYQGETISSDYDLSEYYNDYEQQGETIYRECTITLFSLTHLRGNRKVLTRSQNNLDDFEDQIASLKVDGDCNVTLFNDVNFRGRRMRFAPGVYETALQLKDVFKKASSIVINV